MKRWLASLLTVLLITTFQAPFSITAFAESNSNSSTEDYQWIDGPTDVVLDNKATLTIDEGLTYLDAANTQRFLKDTDSFPNGTEIGSVYGGDGNSNWYVIFEYNDSGHVDDSDKDNLDADELLESYRRGTEEQNKQTTPENQLFLTGWEIKPAYDSAKHQLIYSLGLKNAEQKDIVNYNVNVLTREGYIGVIFVTDRSNFEQNRKEFETRVLNKLTINSGYTYGEFDASVDKKSELGLTSLILGGAGVAVAKKFGLLLLLKKGWFVIVAVVVAAFGWIRRVLTGRKIKNELSSEQDTLSPAEEAYQQHAARQESADSTNKQTDGNRSSDTDLNK